MGKRKKVIIQRKEFSREISIQKKKKTFSDVITEENSASKNNENNGTDLSDDHYILVNFSILQE